MVILIKLLLNFIFIARPCQRCIKRDLASTCMDGVRKKAKYLQDTDGMSMHLEAPTKPLFR